MGASASAGVPEFVTKEKAKELLKDSFDEEKFDEESTLNEEVGQKVVTKARLLELIEAVAGTTDADMALEAWLSPAVGVAG